MFAIFTVASIAWRVFDAWSNLEFIGQKAGLFWRVLHFLFATQAGANTLVIIFVALLVSSLLFQFERRPSLPPHYDPSPPALTAPEKIEKPNLVFKNPEYMYVHLKYGAVFQEGRDEGQYNFDPDIIAMTLPSGE